MNDEDYKKIIEHLNTFPDRQREIYEIKETIFGNPRTGECGMKQKVDEIHEILTQAKGWKSLLLLLVLIGGALTVLRELITR